MPWSLTIGRVGETVVRLHVTMLVLFGWYAWNGYRTAGMSAALEEVVFLALLFLSVLLHEFGHIFAARHYRIGTPEVILTPIGGLARIAKMPDRPREELVIALAGPLVTLLIAAALWGGLSLSGADPFIGRPRFVGDVPLWTALLWTNLFLLLFNLLPAFPMDGGRVLRALLAGRMGLVRGTRIAARVGQVVAVGFGILGLQGNPMLLLIAAFVFLGAQAEYDAVASRDLAGDLTATRLAVTDVRAIPPELSFEATIGLLTSSDQRAFPVLDETGTLLGLATRDDLLRGVALHGLAAPVSYAMVPPSESGVVLAHVPYETAAAQLFGGRREALPVVTEDGRFVGLLTRDNVTDVLLVQRLRRAADDRDT
jgi:Zn-dependent protease/CBS domain-containing protein